MKTEDLQAQGLTEEQIKFIFSENGKDIATEKRRADKAEIDLDSWKVRAETAEGTLKGFEGKDFEVIQKERDDWKKKAEEAEQKYQDDSYARDFTDALNVMLESYKFSSDYAKNAVITEIKEAGLKLNDSKIIGFNDMMESIIKKDPSVIVTEQQQQTESNMAKFTAPANGGEQTSKMTPEQLMRMKNENPGMDISQYI